MPYYIPHYTDSTAIKRGEPGTPEDMSARQQLLREVGAKVAGEEWRQNKGIVPIYLIRRELTQAEMDTLCMCLDELLRGCEPK